MLETRDRHAMDRSTDEKDYSAVSISPSLEALNAVLYAALENTASKEEAVSALALSIAGIRGDLSHDEIGSLVIKSLDLLRKKNG